MDFPKDSEVRIQIRCPQCGGDIDFLEEAQVIKCRYCDSSLLVAGREGVLRYVLPPKVREVKEAQALALEYWRGQGMISSRVENVFLFYAPFWRMQGAVYRWIFGLKPMKVESTMAGVPPPMERIKVFLTRLMDHTILGYKDLQLGLANLGVRTQTISLQPFGPEHLDMRASFLPLEVSLEQVQAEAERYANLFFATEDLIPEVILHRVVGKIFSVIYFPIWYVEGQHSAARDALLVDALGKSILPIKPDGPVILAKLKGEETRKSFKFSEIRFLPFRCPNCGWAFPFRPLSVLHFCTTCRRLWGEKSGEWMDFGYQAVPLPLNRSPEGLLWVPFWRCRTTLEANGKRLETMADLYRLAPPPRVINQEREAHRPIYFYVPAVKFRNPQAIQNLASRLTFIQPEFTPTTFPDGSNPATIGGSLPGSEAREMGPVILGALIPPANRQARTWLKGCQIELQELQLFYFPFAQADLFYKELLTGLSFQRNTLPEDLPPNGR